MKVVFDEGLATVRELVFTRINSNAQTVSIHFQTRDLATDTPPDAAGLNGMTFSTLTAYDGEQVIPLLGSYNTVRDVSMWYQGGTYSLDVVCDFAEPDEA